MEEAELVFEKFVLLHEFNTASIRTGKKHGNKVGKQSESKKSILDKFRISLKPNKTIKYKEPDKENKNDLPSNSASWLFFPYVNIFASSIL